jgi:hypothetical protein
MASQPASPAQKYPDPGIDLPPLPVFLPDPQSCSLDSASCIGKQISKAQLFPMEIQDMVQIQSARSTESNARGLPCLTHDESLVVDGVGRIERCSPNVTALLGWPAGALVGLSVSAIFPELPFAANTPGYNLAYAVFHATEGRWTRRTAVSAQGLKVPVDIALSRATVAGKPCIALRLRPRLFLSPLPAPSAQVDQGRPGPSAVTPVA